MFEDKDSSKKTKLLIFNTLIELLETKPLSHISITDIVKKGNISRQTFYRHFEDLYELLIWSFDHTTTGCKIYDESKDFEGAFTIGFTNILKHPKLYKQLFANDKNTIFQDRLLRSLMKYAKRQVGEKFLDDEVLFALELFWSGYIQMLKKWVISGMKETPETMSHNLYISLPAILKPYYH